MKKLFVPVLILMLAASFMPFRIAKADGNLDEIENYNITVDMQSDGTMDITYHIDWKVLDDTSEGPLSWVKIGIPNRYADNITALGSSIGGIYYYGDGGDYVRIDLDREYYAGEVVPLDFSIHQSHMYTLDAGRNICAYQFTPGWFDGADVKSLKILWNNENVQESNAPGTEGNYLKWTASLSAGERYSVSINYTADVFDTSAEGQAGYDEPLPDEPYNEGTDYTYYEPDNNSDSYTWIIVIIVVVIVIVVTIVRGVGGGGGYFGGFYGGHGGHIGGGGGGGCACASSCACACACACAGGGRAGCSAKNFYGAKKTQELNSALRKTGSSKP